jgi:hypothetical protein
MRDAAALKCLSIVPRQGDMSAEALQQRFALAFKGEARQLFLDLAQLLPSQEQRTQLLSAAAAAGWLQPRADAADAAEPDEQAALVEPQSAEGASILQESDSAWQPLDRSRIAAAASALAGNAAQVHAEALQHTLEGPSNAYMQAVISGSA